MTGSSGRRRWIGVGLVALLAGGLVYSLRKSTSELPVYTAAGARLADGAEIYRPADRKPFTYPPFFAVSFVPLAALPASSHRTIWYLVNVTVLVAVVRMFHGMMRPFLAGERQRRLFWLLTALIAGGHLSAVFENQSHDLLVLGLVMLGLRWAVRGRYARSGGAWGVAAACKATPLLFLPVLALQRRFHAVLAMTGAVIVATLLPDLLYPRADGGLWVVAWYDTFVAGIGLGRPAEAEGAWHAWRALDQSLGGTIYRLSTPVGTGRMGRIDVSLWAPGPRMLRAVTLAAQALVLGWIGWVVRPRSAGGDPRWRRVGETGMVVCGMVLLSPVSSKSHFCVLLIPIGFCVAALLRRRSPALAAALGLILLLGMLTMRDLVGRRLANECGARGTITWCAVVTMAATAAVLRRKDGGDRGRSVAERP
jgi:hypothetical protein